MSNKQKLVIKTNEDKIWPRNGTEDLLLSKTKNCETLTKQTHRKPQKTLECKLTKPRETISFKPYFNHGLDSNWMIGLTGWEVYISIFNITEEK